MSGRARDNWQGLITFAIWLLGVGLGIWLWHWVEHWPVLLQAIAALGAYFYFLAMLPIHELVKDAWAGWEHK
jgi:hypothetical protein